jgi:transcriptional regulator with GAF, ATPase, and Fis domain
MGHCVAVFEQINSAIAGDDRVLYWLSKGTASATGHQFFRALVEGLCGALGTKGAWVAAYIPKTRQLRALAMKLGEQWFDGLVYALEGTPCEASIDHGVLIHIPERLVELYPHAPNPSPMVAVSYLGVPILDIEGNTIGHLAVLHDEPLTEPRCASVLEVFAERAAAEMRRLHAEQEVREREAQLACILDGTLDAIVGLDDNLRVTFLNRVAAHAFGDPDALRGQSFVPWLDTASATRLTAVVNCVGTECSQGTSQRITGGLQLMPQGKPAFRAEASISLHIRHEQLHFTLVLRDVSERIASEERIRTLEQRAEVLQEEIERSHGFSEITGRSPALRAALDDVSRVAPMNTTVLLLGETGTGKELFARAVHHASPRHGRPLIRVNCAAIPRDLIESELFGHERGAFTGATAKREGRFALADGGTLFLDELGELPLELQAKLLRVLQEGEFEPVGSSRTRRVDVRVVAATNRDLNQAVQRGEFREDLYYRLNVFAIRIPPLRQRGTDILLLAERFMLAAQRRIGRQLKPLAESSRERLLQYKWPGNVRELENVIECGAITAIDGQLNLDRALATFEEARQVSKLDTVGTVPTDTLLTEADLRALERHNIARALERTAWKVSGSGGAAEMLGMNPSTLASRIRALGLSRQAT